MLCINSLFSLLYVHAIISLVLCPADELYSLVKAKAFGEAGSRSSDYYEQKAHIRVAPQRERASVIQACKRAWYSNLWNCGKKDPGFRQLHQDHLAGDPGRPLVLLMRHTAIWFYNWVLETYPNPPDRSTAPLAVCEPLFQLLTPHQQLYLVADVVSGLICNEG
jgi:hypothetical protein